MTHWSKTTGVAAVLSMYVIGGSMILWGPPPVKAVGAAWMVMPGMDPLMFSFGYWAGRNIGHGNDDRPGLVETFTGNVDVFLEDECDPFHPDWSKRCLRTLI